MHIPLHLKSFSADCKEKGTVVSVNIKDFQGVRLFEIWYYGKILDRRPLSINNLKYTYIVITEFSVVKIIAESVKTGEEILLFDRALPDMMQCSATILKNKKNSFKTVH